MKLGKAHPDEAEGHGQNVWFRCETNRTKTETDARMPRHMTLKVYLPWRSN